jgi:hypothetical protein
MNLTVTVVFPQSFQIELEDNLSVEKKREQIKDHASYLMETSQSEPVITDCSDSSLVE